MPLEPTQRLTDGQVRFRSPWDSASVRCDSVTLWGPYRVTWRVARDPGPAARVPRPGRSGAIDPRPGTSSSGPEAHNSLAGIRGQFPVTCAHVSGTRDQGRSTRLHGWDPNTWTDKGSPGHTVTKRPKIHRPQAMSASSGRVREGSIRSANSQKRT